MAEDASRLRRRRTMFQEKEPAVVPRPKPGQMIGQCSSFGALTSTQARLLRNDLQVPDNLPHRSLPEARCMHMRLVDLSPNPVGGRERKSAEAFAKAGAPAHMNGLHKGCVCVGGGSLRTTDERAAYADSNKPSIL